MISFLLKLEADCHVSTKDFPIPLNCAINKGEYEAAELLTRKGKTDVNRVAPEGYTPLMYAVLTGDINMVRLLLRLGASVDKTDALTYNTTPLFMAAKRGYADICRLLIDAGADVSKLDMYGNSILYFTKFLNSNHADEIEKMLIEADPNIVPSYKYIKYAKLIAHACDVPGWGQFKGPKPFKFEREGLEGNYQLKRFMKDLQGFISLYPDALSLNLQNELEGLLEAGCNYQMLIERHNQGKPTFVFTGMFDHTVTALIWNDYLLLCNRGVYSQSSVQIFQILKDSSVPEIISNLIRIYSKGDKEYKEYIFETLPTKCYSNTNDQSIFQKMLSFTRQKVGNCVWTSMEQAVFSFMVLSRMKEKGLSIDHSPLSEIDDLVNSEKIVFRNFRAYQQLRLHEKYLQMTELNPKLLETKFIERSVNSIDTDLYPELRDRSFDVKQKVNFQISNTFWSRAYQAVRSIATIY